MMKTTLALALGLGSLLTISSAAAQDGGFFLNGSIGQASIDEDDFDDEDTAYQINGGYRWGSWGIEAGYADLGQFENDVGALNVEAEVDGFTIGLNGRSNFANNWYVSGRLGAYLWDAEGRIAALVGTTPTLVRVDDDGTDIYAGAGVGYNFSDTFSVGAAYDYFGADGDDLTLDANVFSVTAEVRF